MKLWGIAIYNKNLDKVKSAPEAKPTLFSRNNDDVFKTLEEETLLDLISQNDNRPLHRKVDGEHHYVKKMSGKDFYIAIVSQREITPTQELTHLFNNIENAFLRPDVVKISLQEILSNPINYIGRSKLFDAIEDKIQNIKEITRENINLAIKNCASIHQIEEKAINLEKEAEKLKRDAEKTNSCCYGVRRPF